MRQGGKILRQRLKGHILAQYYPPRVRPIQELRREYPGLDFIDEDEETRLRGVEERKERGKGAPKKKRTAAGESISTTVFIDYVLNGGILGTFGRLFETLLDFPFKFPCGFCRRWLTTWYRGEKVP